MSNLETRDYILRVEPTTLDGLLEYESNEAGLRVPVGILAGNTPCVMIDQPKQLRDKEGSLQLCVDPGSVEILFQYEDTLCDIQAAHVDMETRRTDCMLTSPVASLRLYRDRHEQWAAAMDKNFVNHEGILNVFVSLVAGYGLRRFAKNKNTPA